jgi:hypothetical protein
MGVSVGRFASNTRFLPSFVTYWQANGSQLIIEIFGWGALSSSVLLSNSLRPDPLLPKQIRYFRLNS